MTVLNDTALGGLRREVRSGLMVLLLDRDCRVRLETAM
jgi:hypothetical protein